MKTILTFLIIFHSILIFSQDECKKYVKGYIPVDLFDAIKCLDCLWSDNEKNEFKEKLEQDAVVELHFGTGQAIRNSWGIWRGDSKISEFFNDLGITHPDDISGIILTSFHRHLNGIDINLKGQVQNAQEWNDKSMNAQNLFDNKALKEYNKFNVGDSISIYMEVDTARENEATGLIEDMIVMSNDPFYKWKYNPKKDVKITGFLHEKTWISEYKSAEFSIIINEIINFRNVNFNLDKSADTATIDIKYLKLEK